MVHTSLSLLPTPPPLPKNEAKLFYSACNANAFAISLSVIGAFSFMAFLSASRLLEMKQESRLYCLRNFVDFQ